MRKGLYENLKVILKALKAACSSLMKMPICKLLLEITYTVSPMQMGGLSITEIPHTW